MRVASRVNNKFLRADLVSAVRLIDDLNLVLWFHYGLWLDYGMGLH